MERDRDLSGHELLALLYEPPRHIFSNKHGTIVVHGASREERRLIFGALKVVTPQIQKAIDSISILSSGDSTRGHLKCLDNDPANPIVAHCHSSKPSCICVERPYLDKGFIWHEAAHALTFNLDQSFLESWRAIAGDVYGKNRYPPEQAFPDFGVLTRYGSRDELEDIAEWVELIYMAAVESDAKVFKKVAAQKDPRYLRKLLSLYIHDFFVIKILHQIKPLIA